MFIEDLNVSKIFNSYYKEPSELFSWKDVSFLVNNHFYNSIKIIGVKDKDIPNTASSWEGKHIDSSYINKKIIEGHAIILANISKYNEKLNNICKTLEQVFDGSTVDVHAFAGREGRNSSFSIHCDATTNFIFQIEGSSLWTVYKEGNDSPHGRESEDGLTVEIKSTLLPGDVLYIPNRKYHYCKPEGKRLSLSFAINIDNKETIKHINREYYNYE